MNAEVVIVGAAITDLQVYPVKKSVIDTASYPAEKMLWTVGGDALNEATIITRMGHSVRLVSCTGNDAAAQIILSHCKENNISTDCIKIDESKITAVNNGDKLRPFGCRPYMGGRRKDFHQQQKRKPLEIFAR